MNAAAAFELRGWHVGAILVSFFVAVIGADVSFMVLAYRTAPGQVSATPYEDGLAYNRALDSRARQDRLGWTVAASDLAAATGRTLELRWTDRAGAPVTGLKLQATLARPATLKGQLKPAFTEVAPGVYRAAISPLQGAWTLRFAGRGRGGEAFEGEQDFLWR